MGFKLSGVLLLLIMMLGGLFYWYFKDSQKTIALLTENNQQLEYAVSTNEDTIASLESDFERINQELRQVNQRFADAREQNSVLSEKLSQHDIGVLGSQRPGLVENLVNQGSNNASRCFELLSGADLTEQEKRAQTGQEFNQECPWLWPDLVN